VDCEGLQALIQRIQELTVVRAGRHPPLDLILDPWSSRRELGLEHDVIENVASLAPLQTHCSKRHRQANGVVAPKHLDKHYRRESVLVEGASATRSLR
jgi:hypothetical protein